MSLLAALHHRDDADLVSLVLLVVGLACLLGAAWRAWLRDFPAAVGLVLVAIICLWLR